MKTRFIILAAALAFGAFAAQPALTTSAAAADDEYCISGSSDKLVTLRDQPSATSDEAGLGRGGDCGMYKDRCEGGWCYMSMHEFSAWIKESDIRKK